MTVASPRSTLVASEAVVEVLAGIGPRRPLRVGGLLSAAVSARTRRPVEAHVLRAIPSRRLSSGAREVTGLGPVLTCSGNGLASIGKTRTACDLATHRHTGGNIPSEFEGTRGLGHSGG